MTDKTYEIVDDVSDRFLEETKVLGLASRKSRDGRGRHVFEIFRHPDLVAIMRFEDRGDKVEFELFLPGDEPSSDMLEDGRPNVTSLLDLSRGTRIDSLAVFVGKDIKFFLDKRLVSPRQSPALAPRVVQALSALVRDGLPVVLASLQEDTQKNAGQARRILDRYEIVASLIQSNDPHGHSALAYSMDLETLRSVVAAIEGGDEVAA
jgi:hypothetical protein